MAFRFQNLSPHERQPKAKVKKPSKKGEKALPVEKVTVDELVQKFEIQPPLKNPPFSRLFDIFKNNFLDVSAEKGLVDLSNLALSGDGTPVVTAARFRSHHICDCWKTGNFNCDCNRYFPQPDCSMPFFLPSCFFYPCSSLLSFLSSGYAGYSLLFRKLMLQPVPNNLCPACFPGTYDYSLLSTQPKASTVPS